MFLRACVGETPGSYLEGRLKIQSRWVKTTVYFPADFPNEKPVFTFPNLDVTHTLVDPISGRLSYAWDGSIHRFDLILQDVIAVLSEEDIKGKKYMVA